MFEPQARLSPSSINTYLQCPREYYRIYIAKIKPPKNIHLIKGSIVHAVLEDLFKGYQEDIRGRASALYEKKLESYSKSLEKLELDEFDLLVAKNDMENMIEEFVSYIERQMRNLMDIGKAQNHSHAFYLIRPKFREMWVETELGEHTYTNDSGEEVTVPIRCGGFIDRIARQWDGTLSIVDYKTSSRTMPGIKEDYKRQISIYALLYYKQTGELPDTVSIFFLRYGQEAVIPVTQDLLDYGEKIITSVFQQTRSVDINDYQPAGGDSCKFCTHEKEGNKDD